MRRLLSPLGLRPRIVGALLLTSAATLAVAALAVLGPLERRLRDRELSAATSTVLAGRPGFSKLPDLRRGSPARRQTHSLARRTGGAVTVLDSHGRVLYTTDADERPPLDDARRALALNHTVSGFGRDPERGEVVSVAVPIGSEGARYAVLVRKSIRDTAATVDVVKRAVLTAAFAGLALALVLGVALASGLVRRLRRLRAAALEVAAQGPAVSIPGVAGRDEVADLARTLALMQDRLRRQEEIRRAFVSTASHELRTPLASLIGMLELLEDELRDTPPSLPDARRAVVRARAQAGRLARLSEDLLDLSRLDADVPLRREPVEVGELGRAVLAEFELRSGAREVQLEFAANGSDAWALGDPGGVARIVRILVENALRASPPRGTVSVQVRPGERGVALAVADDGPGVPDDEREGIFLRFRRGSTPAAGGEPGFGLGLAIGRELAERMGGTLELDENGHAGARFVLTLAAVAPSAEAGASS